MYAASQNSAAPSRERDRARWLAIGACAVLLTMVLRTAWVAEDAFITLRCIDNWVHGYGLRWNVDERVQAYTHPLWMLLLSAPYAIAREHFLTPIALGLLCTAGAIALLGKLARSPGHQLTALFLAGSSRAFIDYSTSGLENSLSHLLLALFVWEYAVRGAGLQRLTLWAALLALCRMDALLIVLPAMIHAALGSVRARGLLPSLRAALIGGAPLLGWEAFSLVYYGFPFANTAYAKLNTAIPAAVLARQGITYFVNTLHWDATLVIAIGVGVGSALIGRRLPQLLLAAGIAGYLAYVVSVGGDFMLGRFLTVPLFAAVCLVALSTLPLEHPLHLLAFLLPWSWLLWHPSALDPIPIAKFERSGVADERAVFRRNNSLAMYDRLTELPMHPWVLDGRRDRAAHRRVVVAINVGMRAFNGGPQVHYVDPFALAEPLLARLPVRADLPFRIGHYERVVPDGYLATLEAAGACRMTDRALCTYYAKLREIVAGPIWSWHRFETIVAMNLGAYDGLIDRARYQHPESAHTEIASASCKL